MTDLTLDLLRWCSVRATDNGYAEVVVSMQYGGDHDAPWSFRDFKRMVEDALVTRNREIERKASYAVRMEHARGGTSGGGHETQAGSPEPRRAR